MKYLPALLIFLTGCTVINIPNDLPPDVDLTVVTSNEMKLLTYQSRGVEGITLGDASATTDGGGTPNFDISPLDQEVADE